MNTLLQVRFRAASAIFNCRRDFKSCAVSWLKIQLRIVLRFKKKKIVTQHIEIAHF